MKTTIIYLFGFSTISLISSCTFVDHSEPTTRTTTTSAVSPAVYGTVETKTTRSY